MRRALLVPLLLATGARAEELSIPAWTRMAPTVCNDDGEVVVLAVGSTAELNGGRRTRVAVFNRARAELAKFLAGAPAGKAAPVKLDEVSLVDRWTDPRDCTSYGLARMPLESEQDPQLLCRELLAAPPERRPNDAPRTLALTLAPERPELASGADAIFELTVRYGGASTPARGVRLDAKLDGGRASVGAQPLELGACQSMTATVGVGRLKAGSTLSLSARGDGLEAKLEVPVPVKPMPKLAVAVKSARAEELRVEPLSDADGKLEPGEWMAAELALSNTGKSAELLRLGPGELPSGLRVIEVPREPIALGPKKVANAKLLLMISAGYDGPRQLRVPLVLWNERGQLLRHELRVAVDGAPRAHAWLGAKVQDFDGVAAAAKITSLGADLEHGVGVLVGPVDPRSPAKAAGLAPNDIILAIGGRGVLAPADLVAAVDAAGPGRAVTLAVLRKRKVLRLEVTLAPRP